MTLAHGIPELGQKYESRVHEYDILCTLDRLMDGTDVHIILLHA